MHVEKVEIYSDKTNSAVLRHPARKFPGVLIQGATFICSVKSPIRLVLMVRLRWLQKPTPI
jgi:hypothetical protein